MKTLSLSRRNIVIIFSMMIVLSVGMLYNTGPFDTLRAGISDALGLYICHGLPMNAAQIANLRGISPETVQLLKAQRGLTVAELCEIPQAKLDRAIFRASSPKPDHPDEALNFRKLQLKDENGYIPADGLIKAAAQIDSMTARRVSPSAAGITSSSWAWMGPGNVGGRVRALVIHPTSTNTMWAGSVSGGIWKTTNGGATWNVLEDFMANMAVSTLVIDPGNANVLYAGTGEGFYNGDGLLGAGVFKTTNGGTTWTQLSSTNNSSWYYVNRLAISPDSATLLAATQSGIWRSTDGGTIWSQRLANEALDINFDPSNSSKAIASGWGGEAWYSTDGGSTWNTATFTGISGFEDRVELAYAPSNPTIVYASVDDNSGEIWKSVNSGQTYTLVNTGNDYLGGQGWYDNIIWVDPTNANTLMVGGIDLWRSTNGGGTLTKVSQWWSAPDFSAHADNHIIVQSPAFNGTSNRIVYFGNDGGVYRTNNIYTVAATSGWTELNNNLGITQFYGAAGNPTTGEIIGGTQDNGTLFYTPTGGSENWMTTYGGDGGWSAADPTNPNYFYGEYIYLNIHRSSDRGFSADYISGYYWNGSWAWKAAPYRIDDAMNYSASFIAPFILDPNNSNRMLAGGLSLWRTDNVRATNTDSSGPSWAAIKSSVGALISAIAVAPGNSNIVWVGYEDGRVYKTINGTATLPTWSQVDTNSPGLPNRYVTRITIDKNDNNKVYVTFGGFSADNVWRTLNGGTSWTDITGSGPTGLPNLPVRSLVINPTNSNWLYVGTELGIFASEDGGANWTVPHNGPTNTSVDELFWMNTVLVAATHGRGLFKTETLPCLTLTTPSSPLAGGSIGKNPSPNCVGDPTKYSSGTVVTLTATANPGYTFGSWSGDASGAANPVNVTMTVNRSVTANFLQYKIYLPLIIR